MTFGLWQASHACSVVLQKHQKSIKSNIKWQFQNADYIGFVTVLDVEKKDDESRATLKPIRTFKGSASTLTTDWYSEAYGCSYIFEKGNSYIVYAAKHESNWSVSAFGPSTNLSNISLDHLRFVSKYGE